MVNTANGTAGAMINRRIDPALDRRRLVVFFAGLIVFYVGVLLITHSRRRVRVVAFPYPNQGRPVAERAGRLRVTGDEAVVPQHPQAQGTRRGNVTSSLVWADLG
jgi:hypothetical protein